MLDGDQVTGTLGIATSAPRQFSDAEIAELMTVGRLLAAQG
jgi:GAF domain-containing protein